MRATAGPRLGWGAQSRNTGQRLHSVQEPRTPFHQWDAIEVCFGLLIHANYACFFKIKLHCYTQSLEAGD